MKRKRRTHSASFKAKVALVAIRGDKALAELADAAGHGRTKLEAGSPRKAPGS